MESCWRRFTPTPVTTIVLYYPEFDKVYEQAIAEIDRAKAMKLWAQCDQIAINDAPQIILYYDEDYHLIQPWVKDFPVDAQDNNPMKRVWLSE